MWSQSSRFKVKFRARYTTNMSTTRAFYDRQANTIEGRFTVRTIDEGQIVKEFVRLPARSGQKGFENTSWVRGKSPIPFGEYLLWIDKPLQPWQDAGRSGIGHFLNISNTPTDRRGIYGDTGQVRKDIGLHPENGWEGSAGCIVLIPSDEMWEMFQYLGSLETHVVRLTVL